MCSSDLLLRLLEEIAHVPDAQRTAHFTSSICVCGPDGEVRVAVEEICEGILLRAPQGVGGFGYDPIFVPLQALAQSPQPTFAELDPASKDAWSHRGKALRKLLQHLRSDPALLAP